MDSSPPDRAPLESGSEGRRSRADAEALLRTRNTLAAVRAILRLDVAPDLSAQDLALLIDGRVGALARVLASFGPEASARREVEMILRDELVAATVREDAVRIEGPPVTLPFREAQLLALAFHDLTLWSLSEGALGDPTRTLTVAWHMEGAPRAPALLLDWSEGAPSGSRPGSRPVGREPDLDLVQQMVTYGGEGRIEVERGQGGLTCRIRLPLSPEDSPPRWG